MYEITPWYICVFLCRNLLHSFIKIFLFRILERRWIFILTIELDERTQTTGVILCDQAKMLEIGARNAQFKEECPKDLWNEAKELIISFM